MPVTGIYLENIQGLSKQQIPELEKQYGKNIFQAASSRRSIHIIGDIIKEPMFLLLVVACSLYFFLGQLSEGIMMFVAIIIVTVISLYQEIKSTNAIAALQQLTNPRVNVIRNSKEVSILTADLLPGDIVLLEEGMNIPADALILQANDLSVNESAITGESLPVEKTAIDQEPKLYQGTTINSGKCIAKVTAIGDNTFLGKLGKAVDTYRPHKTQLQLQVNKFVRRFSLFGLAAFLIIFLANFVQHHQWISSLLFALTLAMSAIPEEIPVAFSSFMALGAYKMSRIGIISRQPQVIENLGAVSVICLDKTGTITENKMVVKNIYDYRTDSLTELEETLSNPFENVLHYAFLASEEKPFDTMEKAIHEAHFLNHKENDIWHMQMFFEYPLQGRPPMMTHVYKNEKIITAAAKGAPERIIEVCHLTNSDKTKINDHIRLLAGNGYRILGVASAVVNTPLPEVQDNFNWQFEGLLALYDPPKKNVYTVLKKIYDAKIDIKLITGDYPETAISIAGDIGIFNYLKCVTGEEIMTLKESELKQTVKTVNVFARMFPEAKLKVIEALKASGAIVAMTGDGINDGPALKSADVGIAMGKKGTAVAHLASDLILTDDNLDKIADAISEGRKIFSNLKKAIRYIISIHIPIVLTASIPVIFEWRYSNLFTPIHIIFLELIMGPTCSIFFEKEPVEKDIMYQSPKKITNSLFSRKEIIISIIQGIIIACGALFSYYYFMNNGSSIAEIRTFVFTYLIFSNLFLTFVNRSFTQTLYYTSRFTNSLAPLIILLSILFLLAIHFLLPVRQLFQLTLISPRELLLCFSIACLSVIWFEIYKAFVTRLNLLNNSTL